MLRKNYIRSMAIIAIFSLLFSFAYSAFTTTTTVEEKSKNSKYSLKNFSKYSQKSFSIATLKNNLQYKSGAIINPKSRFGSTDNSYVQMQNGNTTYITPFKFKIKAPKFKTPSPNN